MNNLKNYIVDVNKYFKDVLKVEFENIKMKVEYKEKNVLTASDSIQFWN